jgi:hypothetical protein
MSLRPCEVSKAINSTIFPMPGSGHINDLQTPRARHGRHCYPKSRRRVWQSCRTSYIWPESSPSNHYYCYNRAAIPYGTQYNERWKREKLFFREEAQHSSSCCWKSLLPLYPKSLHPLHHKGLHPLHHKSLLPLYHKSLLPLHHKSLLPLYRKRISTSMGRQRRWPLARFAAWMMWVEGGSILEELWSLAKFAVP